jgi:transcriptional regulator with XRE-family HTH domain
MVKVIGGTYVKSGQETVKLSADDIHDKIINLKFIRRSGESFIIRSHYEAVFHPDGEKGSISFKRCVQKPYIKVSYKQVSEGVTIEVDIFLCSWNSCSNTAIRFIYSCSSVGGFMADADNLRKTLSSNIKKYRALLGLSQEKLAEAAGLSEQMVRDIESFRTWVSDKTIVKIAGALRVEAYQLLVPNSEAEKIHPVRLPADVLDDLLETVKGDLERRFKAVVVTKPGKGGA